MQIKNAERSRTVSGRFTKRIGSTLYEVNVYFNEAAKESLEQKIFRLIANDSLQSGEKCVTMERLQTERLPERGSL